MKLYGYIITRDFGFAPNPFPPCCTLTTCKPEIRRTAQSGDWIVGVGSGAKTSLFKNKLVYAMLVHEKLTFDEYWMDPRFKRKRPVMNGSKRQNYGDNIYHRSTPESPFVQENSHHSLPDGVKNILNYNRDLPGRYALIAHEFWYFGENAIAIPLEFLNLSNVGRGYKIFDEVQFIERFSKWLHTLPESGYLGRPYMFKEDFGRYSGK